MDDRCNGDILDKGVVRSPTSPQPCSSPTPRQPCTPAAPHLPTHAVPQPGWGGVSWHNLKICVLSISGEFPVGVEYMYFRPAEYMELKLENGSLGTG